MAIAQDLGIAMIAVEAFKAGEDGALFNVVDGVEVPEFAKEIGIETWAQYSLKWILGDPAMTAVVTETSRPHHVVDVFGALGVSQHALAPAHGVGRVMCLGVQHDEGRIRSHHLGGDDL